VLKLYVLKSTDRKWIYLIILSIIWGTSYILIKKALAGFTPVQLGSVRILLTALFLYIIGFKTLKHISKAQWKWVAISGFVGSFIPVFLFAFAQTQIASSIASILNSLVPLFTLLVGYLFFKNKISRNQLLGVLIGLSGAVLLIYMGATISTLQNYSYAILVVLAAICYAFNVNIIKNKLQAVSPLGIAVGNFTALILPAMVSLWFSGALKVEVRQGPYFWESLGYLAILGFFGTCIAKVLFNKLVKIASPVFSVSVTYLIPVVGLFWGLLDGEKFNLAQLMSAGLIVLGVYLVNLRSSKRIIKTSP